MPVPDRKHPKAQRLALFEASRDWCRAVTALTRIYLVRGPQSKQLKPQLLRCRALYTHYMALLRQANGSKAK